jgi:small subunit ribosomal protein S20
VANHRAAIKHYKQSLVDRARNRQYRTRMRNAVKRFRDTVSGGDLPTAETAFVAAEAIIRRVATKGVIHGRAADRVISRLAHRLNELRSSK